MSFLWEWEFCSRSLTSTSVWGWPEWLLPAAEFRVLNLRGGGVKVWGLEWIGERGGDRKSVV